MPSSFVQLTASLVKSGLVSADEVHEAVSAVEREGQAASAEALAGALHRAGKLTAYQLVALLAGRLDELVFGNYVLLDKIGEGGMGAVYKARHRRMKRVVAIKVVSRAKLNSPERIERFQREVETVSQLSHPNIVTAYDADECALGPYLVMEYVAGTDLAERVQKEGRVPLREAVEFTTQAARALEYAHSQNIIHRDVKPANMLRDAKGTVKITDLGLARLLIASEDGTDSNAQDTDRTTIVGTIDFMAPEQAFNPQEVDHRADIYSLGCTLYYLARGELPYGDLPLMQRLAAHRDRPPRALCENRPDIPASLERVYQRMTAKEPPDRFATMSDVIEALEGCELPDEAAAPRLEPAAAGDAAVRAPEAAPTSWLTGSTLALTEVSALLVEPSRLQSRVIREQFEHLGIRRLQTAAAGEEALGLMRETQPELVVSAMHLPDMTGADLVRKIRDDERLKDAAFVLISSETDNEFLEPVRQAGTAAILPKPFTLDSLKEALMAAVDFFSPEALRAHNLHAAELRVLIADDSRSARRHVRRVLENLGVKTIHEADDGQGAIEQLAKQPVDLVVSDYHMPNVDGPALIRHIRSHPQHRNLPILMITSETKPATLEAARQAGVSAVCSKVFDPHTVCEILAKILGRPVVTT